jgi:hypothetical protein
MEYETWLRLVGDEYPGNLGILHRDLDGPPATDCAKT